MRPATLVVAFAISACRPAVDPDTLVSIAIEPASVLVPGAGESAQLQVVGYDRQGKAHPLDRPKDLEWTSHDPKDVSVSDKGVAEGERIGSAQVTVTAFGMTSNPALVTVAKPAKNAMLYVDEQLVDVVPVDLEDSWRIGYQMTATFEGLDQAPKAGQVMVPTGNMPIAGQVVDVKAKGDQTVATLEVVPLDTLFIDITVDEVFELTADQLVIDEDLAEVYDTAITDDGWVQLTARPGLQRSNHVMGTGAWRLDCTKTGVFPEANLPAPTLNIRPMLSLEVGVRQGDLEKLLVTGSVEGDFDYNPTATAQIGGTLDCRRQLGLITVPLGPLATVYGPGVPVGLGFTLEGQATFANMSAKLTAKPNYGVTMGVDCPAGNCSMVAEGFLDDGDPKMEITWPDPDSTFQLTASAYGYAWATASMGPGPLLSWAPRSIRDAMTFEAFEVHAGFQQAGDFKLTSAQTEDAAYRSSYDLKAKFFAGGKTKLGEDEEETGLEQLAGLLGVSLDEVKIELEEPYSQSPHGTWDWSGVVVEAGTEIAIPITLQDVTYLGLDNVDAVRIYRVDSDGGDTILTTEALLDRVQDGQTDYVFRWTPTVLDASDPPTFAAFVDTTWLPILPVEITEDSRGTPTTAPAAVTVTRRESEIFAGDVVTYFDQLGAWTQMTSYASNMASQTSEVVYTGPYLFQQVNFEGEINAANWANSIMEVWITVAEPASWEWVGTCDASDPSKITGRVWPTAGGPDVVSLDGAACPAVALSGTIEPGEYVVSTILVTAFEAADATANLAFRINP